MNPWHIHEMAVDRAGNVYARGERIDGHSANLIRKYSRDGVFEREFMPAAMFPHGENATSPDSWTESARKPWELPTVTSWGGPSFPCWERVGNRFSS
jgi:hypothetical protein